MAEYRLVEQFAVVFDNDFLNVADGPAGNDQLGVFVAHGQLDGVILDGGTGATVCVEYGGLPVWCNQT